ncbi:MAG: hypothetical protein IPN67_02775 [Bacteroidales bacterium]|nr:hypothetical protein [Bacteroidales bacterium]
MKTIPLFLLGIAALFIISCNGNKNDANDDIVIENDQVKLIIAKEGYTKSLVNKPSGEECLLPGKKLPICTVTQERPYQNEIKLAYPTKETTFRANSVRREGDRLIIEFELIPWEAVVGLKITPAYMGFTIEDFRLTVEDYGISMDEPAISEMWFLQLPVRNRTHYGDWLNVIWDNNQAINILATDPFARIDSEEGEGCRILKAGVTEDVKLKGAGAALIVCPTDKLLDNIATVEDDYNLPHGVKSRRSDIYNASYYWSYDVLPSNIDEHIKYAKMAGFRAFMIYYPSFIDSRDYRKLGDYDWRKPEFMNGREDLEKMLNKIKEAGMVPGFHFLHSHIGRDSRYITPIPDHRLNLLKMFTLAAPMSKTDTTIFVGENPANITMTNDRRVLKIGTELISYKNYTTSRPFKFNGCVRGIDETTVNAQPAGFIFGLLDVSEFGATSVYVNQKTDLQEEIAQKLGEIYKAGFQFVYFDGSEGVNPPFWFNVSYAQWKVYSQLKPEPLFAEGAAKTHFSWHMLTRGNAFDIFKPEKLKESIRKFPADEAPRMSDNFTHINFGWLGYWLPDTNTIGTQPDQLEYVTSRAAAWDCPVSIMANLELFAAHPRTPDNMEVLRRWEEVRAKHWLSDQQKQMLMNLKQEHILLLNEKNDFELVPYDQITNVANGSRKVQAFTFSRNNDHYVVYWHISGNKELELPISSKDFTLLEDIGKEIQLNSVSEGKTIVPVGNRHYIKTNKLTLNELVSAFGNARIVD